jgi:hypothetical protein
MDMCCTLREGNRGKDPDRLVRVWFVVRTEVIESNQRTDSEPLTLPLPTTRVSSSTGATPGLSSQPSTDFAKVPISRLVPRTLRDPSWKTRR